MQDEPACFMFERFLNFNREAHEANPGDQEDATGPKGLLFYTSVLT
jgi:hypothetical protein